MIYFDVRPSSHVPTLELRVCDACIFIDFTKQVLAVDQLEPSPPERLEVETQAFELLLLEYAEQLGL